MHIAIVDILCCQSLYKITKLKSTINNVYYCSLSKCASLILKFISRFTHIKFQDLSKFPSSMIYKNKKSCYEEIEERLTYLCNTYYESLENDPAIIEYCKTYELDLQLVKGHLWQNAYWLLYRPVEIMVKSELINLGDSMVYLFFKKSPVVNVLLPVLKKTNVKLIYYQYLGFKSFLINRDEYVWDEYIKEIYFNYPLGYAMKILKEIMLFVINSFFYEKFGKRVNRSQYHKKNNASIGVDKYLVLAEEEFFWLKGSQINPEDVYYFEERKPLLKNVQFLKKNKIRRVHIVRNPLEWFKNNVKNTQGNRLLISGDWGNVRKFIVSYVSLWIKGVVFCGSEYKWKIFMLLQLIISYTLWKNVFRRLGLKILISFSDVDPMNSAKTMAANYSNGIVVGGHFSNQPLYSVSTERFYHVVFTWGPHFYSHLFNSCPERMVVITGYYFDYLFKEYRVKANKIRMKHSNKFIITFMDNVFYKDTSYSEETVKMIYETFFNIINSHKQVVLFVKTKRAEVFNKTRRIIPAIDEYIKRGRIIPFINDPDTNNPYKPVHVALSSDLVIGLGISTAATESQFAGIPSFHFDLSSTSNNQFVKNGLGTVVFQSLQGMREAIERQLNQKTALSFEKIDDYYKDLDPFRDGRATERIGTCLKWFQDGFKAGFDRETVIANATENYCKKWGHDKIILGYLKHNTVVGSVNL